MPSLVKRNLSKVPDSPFTMYAGDTPTPGGYRAVIKQLSVVKSSGDNLMYKGVLELKAKPGSDKAKYDGYPVFPQFVMTDNESNQQREKALYIAICGKADVDIKVDGKPESFKPSDGQKAAVQSIGGVSPVGKVVNVSLRFEPDNRPEANGAMQLRADMIFADREGGVEEVDDVEEDDIEDDEEVAEYTEDELNALALAALRAILVDEFGMEAADAKAIKSKKALVSEILDQQADAEDDEDEEDEDEDADDVEDEESDEEDDDEDEEDDEEEDDQEAEIREELGQLDRAGLRAVIKKREPAFKFLKSQTDEALLEKAVELRLQDPPF